MRHAGQAAHPGARGVAEVVDDAVGLRGGHGAFGEALQIRDGFVDQRGVTAMASRLP